MKKILLSSLIFSLVILVFLFGKQKTVLAWEDCGATGGCTRSSQCGVGESCVAACDGLKCCCSPSCSPGTCVSSGSCYLVIGVCVQSGWNGCASCFNDCPDSDGCGGGTCSNCGTYPACFDPFCSSSCTYGCSSTSCSGGVCNPPPSSCTLSINPTSVVSGTGGTTTVTYSGSVSSAAPAQNVRLFLERRDSLQISNYTSSLSSTDTDVPISEEGPYDGRYYYQVAGCPAGIGGSCNESVDITAPPAGYYFHCDVATDPNKCSGNPFCSYEGGTLDCSGWQSCSNSDNGTFDVYLPPSCSGVTFPSCIPPGASFTVTANGVNNATQVKFPTWSSANGQDDLFWYTDNNGAPWQVSIPQSSHLGGDINVHVYMDNNSSTNVWCDGRNNIPLCVIGSWWQVKDSDVVTNDDIVSRIYPAGTEFILPGLGGYPGVAVYGGTTADFQSGAGTGTVSLKGWLANTTSTWLTKKTYDYKYFREWLPATWWDETEMILPAGALTITNPNYFRTEGTTVDGYLIYYHSGDLTINATQNMLGQRAVLFVDDGDLTINKNINLDDGLGFFMAVVEGNIIIDPAVASIDPTVPSLEGFYTADNQFQTGTKYNESLGIFDDQLHVRGSVVGLGGVLMERNLGTDNTTDPAEVFEYAPDLVFTYPAKLSVRKMRWKEVAP